MDLENSNLNDQNQNAGGDIEMVTVEVPDHPAIRRAKILRLKTGKLSAAFNELNIDTTKKFLLEVELDISELEINLSDDITDEQYAFIDNILTASKEVVDTVNKALTFAGKASRPEASSSENSDPTFEYEDIKFRYKSFSFDGEIRQWMEFWDRFNAQVNSRKRLSKITKFTFLLECLKGKALELVKGLAVTESNFDAAILKLKERYDNPERLVTSYFDELEEIIPSDDAATQRSNYDTITKILKNLESLGAQVDHDYLKKIVEVKFSRDTLRGAIREVKRNKGPSYSTVDLMASIDETLTIEEDIDIAHRDRQVRKKNSSEKIGTGVLVNGGKPSNKKNQSNIGPIRNKQKLKQKDCVFCDSNTHNAQDCGRHTTLSRRKTVLIKKGLCFVCLQQHKKGACAVVEPKCPNCHKVGHLLHLCIAHMITINDRAKKNRESSATQAAGTSGGSGTSNGSGTFLQTFICTIKNPKVANSSISVRGLFDPGSKCSYINEGVCRRLRVKATDSTSLSCFIFGSNESYDIDTKNYNITFINNNGSTRNYSLISSPCITGAFRTSPNPSLAKSCLPEYLTYADPDLFSHDQRPIDILIGADLYNDMVDLTKIKKLPNNIILLDSFFGWVPSGNISSKKVETSVMLAGSSSEPRLTTPVIDSISESTFTISDSNEFDFADLTDLSNFWKLETVGIKASEIDNDCDKVLDQFHRTKRIENNRYVARWPWKHSEPNLPSNYRVARARLRSLVSSSTKDFLSAYNDVFKDYLNKGIIEIAPKDSPYIKHYLPHRGIFQKGKIRIVFDGSSKPANGFSINELIFKGPNLQKDIVKLLLNFRMHRFGITADIEKAFLQISLNEVDRDSVRFMWIKDIDKPAEGDNIIHFRFARVPFGINASPYLLNIVINDLLSTSPANEWHLLAAERFYVDNLVVSVPDTNSAVNLYQSVTSRFAEISMNLRDWASNDQDLIKSLPTHMTEKKEGLISILGIMWDRTEDNLFVKLNSECPSEPTKRNVLKFLASIFDPLGFFSPSTLKFKVFLQECWKNKYGWSDRLPSHLEAEMIKIRSDLSLIPTIPVPRRVWTYNRNGQISLHVFCDASKIAYACCAYLVYFDPETCVSASTLVMSKVRLSPMKILSMPRLELMGVLIGKRIASFIRENLSVSLHEVIIWTDATTVLQWLNSSLILPQFVHNRVVEIKRTPGLEIRYISGKQNPADIASRGESVCDLKDMNLWWKGPAWINCRALWPSTPPNSEPHKTKFYEDSVVLCSGVSIPHLLTENIEHKYSTWRQRVRIFEHVYRFCYILLSKIRNNQSYIPDNTELRSKAEISLVREMQRKYCGKEYRVALRAKIDYIDQGLSVPETLRIKSKLDLFMGEELLLRCGGRIENASLAWDTIHPILLPRKSAITRSYVRDLHIHNKHIGLSHLLSKIREKYWIVKGRMLIKSVIYHCVDCRRWTGGSFRLPAMPPLPKQRVEEATPFLNVGIDFMGPLNMKAGNNVERVYIVIFACLVSRAIHLEIARDTTAIEFLRALSRFGSIRGCPDFIITDNASNFVFIQPMVSDKVNITNRHLLDYCATNGIKWKFIPQYSPWQGGVYERLIGLVKNCLRKSYSQRLLDYVDLLTAIYDIADIINSRPLTYVSTDEVISSLTPNHFLRLRSKDMYNSIQVRTNRTDLSARKLLELWGHIAGVVENFWSAFNSQYLTFLREKHSRNHTSSRGSLSLIPKVNDVVLVKEEGVPRGKWKLGRIISLDSRKAVAILRCDGGELTRSVNFLYPLELPYEESDST